MTGAVHLSGILFVLSWQILHFDAPPSTIGFKIIPQNLLTFFKVDTLICSEVLHFDAPSNTSYRLQSNPPKSANDFKVDTLLGVLIRTCSCMPLDPLKM